MSVLTHTDTPMHRVRLYVPTECGRLLENVYETFTHRTYRLWGVPVWRSTMDVERRPLHEFLHKVFGS